MNGIKIIIDEISKIESVEQLLKKYEDDWSKKQEPYSSLNKALQKSTRKTRDILRDLSISRSYYYKIINATSKPFRDVLIELLIALRVDIYDVQEILEANDYLGLDYRIKRELIVIYVIVHGKCTMELNELLYDNKLPLIGRETRLYPA